MRTVIFCLCLLVSFFIVIAWAQKSLIKGRVVDSSGEPISNASILVKGSRTGTATNEKGSFSLTLSKLPSTLVISAIGFGSKEVKVTEKTLSLSDLKIILKPVTSKMTEVVIAKDEEITVAMDDRLEVKAEPYAITRKAAPNFYFNSEKSSETTKAKVVDKTVDDGAKISSHLLTAGEVSDFKKWKMWEDFSENEFDAHKDFWEMSFTRRYSVQVQNEVHRAVTGKKVYLISQGKDTVWTAVTDNTGKAELWGDGKSRVEESLVLVCGDDRIKNPGTFEQGVNRMVVKESCSVSPTVDIAFVVDATGSMGDEIQYLQKELDDIISHTAEKYKGTRMRLGSVFYRDVRDEYLTRYQPFTEDASVLMNFISKQSARGGGDTPEAVEEALTTALDSMEWSAGARSRILFLILDAPPHDEAKGKMALLMKNAAAKGIRIVPVVCSGATKSTEYLMRCAALATNGTYLFLTDDSGVGETHIKPTTDNYKVELLNDLIRRIIGEMIFVNSCETVETAPIVHQPENILDVKLYPNPSTGPVTLEINQSIKEIYLTDFTGKILKKIEGTSKSKSWKLNLSSYPSGTYLVKYLTNEGKWGAEKVVVAR